VRQYHHRIDQQKNNAPNAEHSQLESTRQRFASVAVDVSLANHESHQQRDDGQDDCDNLNGPSHVWEKQLHQYG
jgi:hypothetical protein